MADIATCLYKLALIVALAFTPTSSLIAHLFLISSPPTIIRTITLTVPDTIESFSGGSGSHIFKELNKRFYPLRTYGDSPAPIVTVSGVVGIKTSLFHIQPRYVFPTISLTMSLGCLRGSLSLKTSTTAVFTSFKLVTAGYRDTATITVTNPFRVASILNNYQSIEPLTFKI